MSTEMNNDLAIQINFEDEEKTKLFTEAMEKLHRDADAMAALEQSGSLKDIYTAFKKYCPLSFDEYEQLSNKLMDQFQESAAKLTADRELTEDELDVVTGGSWSSFWKTVGTIAIGVAIVAAVAVTAGAAAAGIAAAVTAISGIGCVGASALGWGLAVGGAVVVAAVATSGCEDNPLKKYFS